MKRRHHRRQVPGTVRFRGDGRRYCYAKPGEPRYSTYLMLATEYYNGKRWEQIDLSTRGKT